jgi:hypothetical protein
VVQSLASLGRHSIKTILSLKLLRLGSETSRQNRVNCALFEHHQHELNKTLPTGRQPLGDVNLNALFFMPFNKVA